MIFKQLNIYSYSDGKKGNVSFQNPDSTVELKLNDEACTKILKICAEQLVSASKEVANNLTAAIIDSTEKKLLNVEK